MRQSATHRPADIHCVSAPWKKALDLEQGIDLCCMPPSLFILPNFTFTRYLFSFVALNAALMAVTSCQIDQKQKVLNLAMVGADNSIIK